MQLLQMIPAVAWKICYSWEEIFLNRKHNLKELFINTHVELYFAKRTEVSAAREDKRYVAKKIHTVGSENKLASQHHSAVL